MNSTFITVTLATLAVIYLIGKKMGAPATRLGAALRIALYTGIIGLSTLAYLVLANASGAANAPLFYAVPLTAALTMLTFLYTYRAQRAWNVTTVASTAMLAALVWLLCMGGAPQLGLGMVFAIPLALPLLRRLDFAPRQRTRLRKLTRVTRRPGPMHLIHPDFEIAYVAGAERIGLKLAERWVYDQQAGKSVIAPPVDTLAPALHERQGPVGQRWENNLGCLWRDLYETYSETTSSSTYVPGSVSTGFTTSGELVNVMTPGQTVYTSTPTGRSHSVKTGQQAPTLALHLDGVYTTFELARLKPADMKQLKEVLAAIDAALAPRRDALNAAAVVEHERERSLAAQQQADLAAARLQRQQQSLAAALQRAGIAADGDGVFVCARYHPVSGELRELIAADRGGRGAVVAASGEESWHGSWSGAEARVEQGVLQVKLDDPAYRDLHLAERRFQLSLGGGAMQQEWADRIPLLAARAGQA